MSAPSDSVQSGSGGGSLLLSSLLGRTVADTSGQMLGHVMDVIVHLRDATYPVVTGVVVAVGGRRGRRVFVPADQVVSFGGTVLKLASARMDVRAFERRNGEVLLRADVLRHRLIDVETARMVSARDFELTYRGGAWVLAGVDIRRAPRRFGLLARPLGPVPFRDWMAFEPLIGHADSIRHRRLLARLRVLKPAQIADLIEEASPAEETELLHQVRADPDLEADVFEELTDQQASRLLEARTDPQVAEVLARMRPDDAADAVMELPQRRRLPVLGLLPPAERDKIMTLLSFNPATAGGLMGVDVPTFHADTTAGDALAAVATGSAVTPEAGTGLHLVDADHHLVGVTSLLAVVRADPASSLTEIADRDPIQVTADIELVDLARLMADYNLTSTPVVDAEGHLIGLVTIDDVLEAVIPSDWRRREPAPHGGRHIQRDRLTRAAEQAEPTEQDKS